MLPLLMVMGLLTTPVHAEFSPTKNGANFENELRLSFACAEEGVDGTSPAKNKNITWKIKGNAPSTDIQKGIVQTDPAGVATIKINSDVKDLEGVIVVLGVGEQKLNVLIGNGPYSFDDLPMAVCK